MNLIHHLPDGWHFLDETGDLYGPYATEAEARDCLAMYCKWLNSTEIEDTQKNHLHFIVGDMFE
jgi:hypothetical protein